MLVEYMASAQQPTHINQIIFNVRVVGVKILCNVTYLFMYCYVCIVSILIWQQPILILNNETLN